MQGIDELSIAVIIPCYNEEIAIQSVIAGFRATLPEATIYVYDNNSTDRTADVARAAGALVRAETQQGKGHVVRRMFADVEADIYVLVDGDNTYEIAAAPRMIERLLTDSLDMVTGCRVSEVATTHRPGHRLGNRVLTGLVAGIFGTSTRDVLSGYRVFSRRFVKSFPAFSRGFEIETELTVHALELRVPMMDIDTKYVDRSPDSESKLGTFKDGLRILYLIASLVKEERPHQLFGFVAAVLAIAALALAYPVITEYVETGLVPRFPTAILASAIMIAAILSFFAGLILDTVTLGRREMKRIAYLHHSGPRITAKTRKRRASGQS